MPATKGGAMFRRTLPDGKTASTAPGTAEGKAQQKLKKRPNPKTAEKIPTFSAKKQQRPHKTSAAVLMDGPRPRAAE
ncbi:MAG: hypothetical protein ACOYIR_05415 [Christensenellales bacterium]